MAAVPSTDLWRGGSGGECRCWATASVTALLLLVHLLLRFRRRSHSATSSGTVPIPPPSTPIKRTQNIIDDTNLKELIRILDEKYEERERMERIISKRVGNMSYEAWYEKMESGPPRYFSITTFEGCSTEHLRDFYMDDDYRKKWDSTLLEHKQLQYDEASGTEIGYSVKKFPFLTPREYILAWRLWEASDKTFYCYIKDCEHPLIKPQRNRVRVLYYRSGWCIRKVPDKDACTVLLVHQEDNGLNFEMAKLAFVRGSGSYLSKMSNALQCYPSQSSLNAPALSAPSLIIKKVPPELENNEGKKHSRTSESVQVLPHMQKAPNDQNPAVCPQRSLKKGLFLLGSVVFLCRGHSNFGAQLAMVFALNRYFKKRQR